MLSWEKEGAQRGLLCDTPKMGSQRADSNNSSRRAKDLAGGKTKRRGPETQSSSQGRLSYTPRNYRRYCYAKAGKNHSSAYLLLGGGEGI